MGAVLELSEVLAIERFPVVVGALLIAAAQQPLMQRVVIQGERHPGQMKGDAAGSDDTLDLGDLGRKVPTNRL